MKKVLMVIFVLSLLGVLAAPVLANVLAETRLYNEVAPLPGDLGRAGGEEPVQVAKGRFRPAGVEDPVQVARITIRPSAP